MKNMKQTSNPKHLLNLPLTLLLAVLLSGLYTLLCLWIQPNSLRAVLSVFRSQPLLIVLNCLPIGLLILTFTCIFRNVFSAACLVGTGCAVLSLANRIKLEVRDEPVFPRDLGLLKETGSAVGTYSIQWPWTVIAVILVFMAVMAICAHLIGCKPFPLSALGGWLGRAVGAIASLAALAALVFTVYSSNDLYNSFKVSNPYYVPAVFNELGFPYCFTHHFTTYTVDKPADFDRSQAEAWDRGGETAKAPAVNVIMVMNEAFSDLSDWGMFNYSSEDNPLSNLHALQKDKNCLSGHIVVPGFAGGTANTEFDVLTGMQTNALSATTTSAFRAFNRNLDSLFRVYGAEGANTSFYHPGDAWFYNRENVYRYLGAEEILFAEDMPDISYKGRWATDDSLAGLMLSRFDDITSSGETMVNYTTTIQNHMSYTSDKYGADYNYPALQTSAELSRDVETLVKVYVEGARDADAMLGKLVTAYRVSSEPVVLAFWGDHLPYLGDNQSGYRELGATLTPDENGTPSFLKSYETPFIIWANDAAAQALDWQSSLRNLGFPENGTISACYLGATILELTGRSAESPWFQYLGEMRRTLPVIHKETVMLPDGTVATTDTLDDKQAQLLSKLRCWSYYKLKYKDVG